MNQHAPSKLIEAQIEKYKHLADDDGLYEATIVCADFIGQISSGKILDIGCGNGSFLRRHFPQCEKYGIEITDLAANGASNDVQIAQHDVEKGLPFADGFFDAIAAQMIIEHLVDTDHFLAECHRVLRVGGTLVLTTPNLASPRVILRLLFGKQPDVVSYSLYDGCRHMRYYTFSSLKGQLEQRGYTVVKRHGAIGFRNLLLFLPIRMRMKIFEIFPGLGGELVVKATKN